MAHANCMLDTRGYEHTIRICNNYCFSKATMISRMRLCLGRGYTAARTDRTQQPGQTPDKEINHIYDSWQRIHWNWSDWHVVCQQLPTVWPNKLGLFRADFLARYRLQFAYDLCVVATDKTYLIELVRDVMPPLWDQRYKNYRNRSQDKTLGCDRTEIKHYR